MTSLTFLSVVWALKSTAISSVNASRWSSGTGVRGYISSRIRPIFAALSARVIAGGHLTNPGQRHPTSVQPSHPEVAQVPDKGGILSRVTGRSPPRRPCGPDAPRRLPAPRTAR